MSGRGNVRFSELFVSTFETHGLKWTRDYYTRRGMQEWEFKFWLHAYCTD